MKMLQVLNALSNWKVFNLDLKTDKDDASVIEMGKSFQSLGATTEKAQSPLLFWWPEWSGWMVLSQ